MNIKTRLLSTLMIANITACKLPRPRACSRPPGFTEAGQDIVAEDDGVMKDLLEELADIIVDRIKDADGSIIKEYELRHVHEISIIENAHERVFTERLLNKLNGLLKDKEYAKTEDGREIIKYIWELKKLLIKNAFFPAVDAIVPRYRYAQNRDTVASEHSGAEEFCKMSEAIVEQLTAVNGELDSAPSSETTLIYNKLVERSKRLYSYVNVPLNKNSFD